MAKRPRIGVTGDHRRWWAPSWWSLRLGLRLIGAQARRISVADPADGERFDALVISGGNDIGPELYGGTEMPKARIDRARDELEISWIHRALEEGWPLLGICRGAQLLNVVLGGSLVQDIRPLRQRTSNRASLVATKRVTLAPGSRVARVCHRSHLRVNSLHHQAVDRAGDGLRIVGRDRDGICQAIEGSRDHRVLGVQWHPEYLIYLPAQLRLFRWLVDRTHDRQPTQGDRARAGQPAAGPDPARDTGKPEIRPEVA